MRTHIAQYEDTYIVVPVDTYITYIKGSIKALLRLYYGSIKALLRLYKGSTAVPADSDWQPTR